MPSLTSWFSDVSRRKLRVAASGRDGLRDTINLHRFVLLKNSITQAEFPSPSPSCSQPSLLVPGDNDQILVYPDADAVTAAYDDREEASSSPDSEEKWLESVLETLDDDFDGEVEVQVHPVEDDDLDFPDTVSDDPYEPWTSHYDRLSVDPSLPVSQDHFVSSPSAVLSPPPPFPQPPSLQLLFDSPDSPFNQPFIEPRYPEADFDLPISEASSDSDSDDDDDDDDGPLTPFSGSQPSLDEQGAAEPEVYVEQDSYFLYPSELDPISPQPLYYQQC